MTDQTDPPVDGVMVAEPLRERARVECARCTWGAVHLGPPSVEVAHFLRNLLIAHIEREHTDLAEIM